MYTALFTDFRSCQNTIRIMDQTKVFLLQQWKKPLPHFSKPHISYLTESEISVPQLTGTSQKTNQGFLTFLLLENSPQLGW